MTKINHHLFGEISYDLYWSGQAQIKIFGVERNVILSIDGNEEAVFQDAQKEAYSNFVNNVDTLMIAAEEVIFNYYQEIYMDYREMVRESEADKVAPIIENKEELVKLVEPNQLIIKRVRENGIRKIGLLFNCT